MMKLIGFLVVLTPLSFFLNFWLSMMMMILISIIFMFNISMSSVFLNISYFFGCDLISYTLVLLSLWICFLMILASEKVYLMKNYENLFIFMVLVLLISLVVTFSVMDLFIFYLFFEISLIPTLILILGWGYQPERIQAGMYLLFYTLLASLPMMIVIFYYYNQYNSLDFWFLSYNLNSVFMYLCMNLVFFIKMPLFFVHLWLPKAHVEAPVAGSMILAGIMLKLGGYGLLRFMVLFVEIGVKINIIFINISLVGGVIVSLICLRQSDIKSLIAYSSVAHMGLVVMGIMSLTLWGLSGALVMMLAHGLCSSGLFALANISYERVHSRSVYLNKGLINIMPSMSMWWFLLSSSNMAAPPSFNLLGEIMLINSMISFSYVTMLMLMFISFFSAAYSLYLYAFTQHGALYSGLYSVYSGVIREFLLLLLHWLPLNLLILKSDSFCLWL
uniref:NADH-ubiquinone oxidoreductase chain 4 n=1 Tax=Enicmus brevicornis TaxID=346775 RepID=S4SVM6_9CUCU|nr:NADH dehydrogenase subunit 4 [Enicmus brevicornis]